MLEPRCTGAGTPRRGPSRPSHPGGNSASAAADDPYDTRSAETHGNPLLTPAQRLIERYERLSTPPPPQTPPAERSTYRLEYRTGDVCSARQYMGPGSLATPMDAMESHIRGAMGTGLKKDRSPIRQSLKNLFSVLKKGAGGLSKRRSEDREPIPAFGAVGAGVGLLLLPSEDPGGAPSGSFFRPKRMTGSLHYLTHSPSFSPDSGTQGAMSWTPCSVTLEPEGHKLLVSSFNTSSASLPGEGMELHVHEIALKGCVNIRSLSAAQLSAAEARLLSEEAGVQGEGDKLKVFEILFEEGSGRVRERLAARSVRERAGWISAIWDAVLPSQETKDIQPQAQPILHVVNVSSVHKSSDNQIPKPLPQSNEPISPSYSDRSLPALPPKSPLPIPTTLPLSLPTVAPLSTPKKVPNLHLDLSEFKRPLSPPKMRPPPSHTHGQFSPNDGVISPSIYPPTSRPVSIFIGSPISPVSGLSVGSGSSSASPNSPSIRNLSQLSVVRQRLAQIERNHSELSAESKYSSASTTSSPGPVSPAGSGWSKREAIFHNAGPRAGTKRGSMSRSSSRTGSSKLASSLHQAPPLDESNKIDDSGYGKEECTPKAKSKTRSNAMEETPTKTIDFSTKAKEDIRKISRDVADIRHVLGKEPGNRSVQEIVIGLEQRAQGDKKDLRAIKDTLKVLEERVAEVVEMTKVKTMADVPSSSPGPIKAEASKRDYKAIVQSLNEVKNRLYLELPSLASKLQDIKDAQEREKDRAITCVNVSAPPSSQAPAPPEDPSKTLDPKTLLDKLEEIQKLCQPPAQVTNDKKAKEEGAALQESLTKILGLIQEDSNKQILLAQQQADSVRYLNELNTWLESFVNNGTSQIQGISASIDRLCNEIGAGPAKPGAPGGRPNLVNDIRQLVDGMKARDQNFASLQAAVHSLLEVLTALQTQKGADAHAIAGLMDQQRHAQEVMFRAFTNEISSEIKGERIRFVDAMKEATAINVHLHVEQFKQELNKEVMSMTEEVGRLHREKQQIENQISDLFSFYSKHKQTEMPLQTIQPNTVRQSQEPPRANLPRSSQLRALPNYPRPQ